MDTQKKARWFALDQAHTAQVRGLGGSFARELGSICGTVVCRSRTPSNAHHTPSQTIANALHRNGVSRRLPRVVNSALRALRRADADPLCARKVKQLALSSLASPAVEARKSGAQVPRSVRARSGDGAQGGSRAVLLS